MPAMLPFGSKSMLTDITTKSTGLRPVCRQAQRISESDLQVVA
jgi:hypothetical protein